VTGDDLPLPTLLSRPLIAFTTEFDNEAEHRLEHRGWAVGAAAPRLDRQARRQLTPRCRWGAGLGFAGLAGARWSRDRTPSPRGRGLP
jgi:hypothetical protein